MQKNELNWIWCLNFGFTSRVEKQCNDKIIHVCIGFGAQEILLLHFKQKKKDNDQKVDRLSKEWNPVPGIHTFSCYISWTNIPPGSLHACMQASKQASTAACMLFLSLSSHGIFFSIFSVNLAPRTSFSTKKKVITQKQIWGYNKIKETPNNITHSHCVFFFSLFFFSFFFFFYFFNKYFKFFFFFKFKFEFYFFFFSQKKKKMFK